ncbi:Pc12g04220 [Talaromyces islandicus]|uniref:Pc12g04220 n=1 Tax=Talaromyces islandicus TaxID=28573 RepID=A0A0U1MAI6_TALIS|nr:Pc12g04220 [Talaromyces islandicus]
MNPPAIPRRISSLIPQVTQQAIAEHDKKLEWQKSAVSLSSIRSSVSEYLEEKFKECRYDLAASLERLGALQQAVRQGTIGQEDYNQAEEPFFEYQKTRLNEKKLLSKQRRLLEADISEELDTKKPRFDEPDVDFYERAYMSSIIPRVMGASAKQSKSTFDSKRFKDGVLKAYNAIDASGDVKKAWCHVSHYWYKRSAVKAAHLVPKTLSDPEIGITLYQTIEEALDQGAIVIIPKPVGDETRWECVLVDKSKANHTAIDLPTGDIKWRDLDHQELEFKSETRPARRYLYFRFIITVIHAKRTGNEEFISQLQQKDKFWASPGRYLQRATIVALARNISGLDLPESIYNDTTFPDAISDQEAQDTAMILASDLRAAYVESVKKSEERCNLDDIVTESEDESDSDDDEMEISDG